MVEHTIEHVKNLESGDPPGGPQPPAAGWASGPLGAAQRAHQEMARQTALQARAVATFAATRPASVDRQPGEKGCMSEERRAARPEVLADVSEWATQELAVALSISSTAAESLLTRSLTLVHRLPATLTALEAGVLHSGHLWPMLEKVAPIADPRVRRQVETGLLGWAAGRVTTPAQLGAKARRMVLARDARGAAQRLTTALRRRGVSLRGDDVDGLAAMTVLATVPEAQALHDALGRYADALDDEPGQPPRTRGQKMVDCLLDLVLRPGEHDLPPVRAQVTLIASVATMAGGDEPGEVGGEPVPAEMVRSLARALGLLPQPAPCGGETALPAGERLEDVGAPSADRAADERWWADVEARALRGDWGGADAPPAEDLRRLWSQDAQCQEDLPDRADGSSPNLGAMAGSALAVEDVPVPEWWATADRAVDAAGLAVLELGRRLASARSAVEFAEIADIADEEAWEQSSAARVTSATDAISALTAATADRRAGLVRLLETTRGGGLADRPRIAVTDALTGTLLALTDSRELRDRGTCGNRDCRTGRTVCDHDLTDRPGLGPPDECATYRPGAALDRFARARDRRCRFPGCRRRVPRGGELDHHVPWPDGATSAGNLTGFCTSHHRGKHQAPGWRYDLSPDGTLTVATPTGLVASTSPPPY